jgi:hypothetical protein
MNFLRIRHFVTLLNLLVIFEFSSLLTVITACMNGLSVYLFEENPGENVCVGI